MVVSRPKEMILLSETYSFVSSSSWCKGAEGYRARSREVLTCKPMGRPASSRVGPSHERWLVIFCVLAYKQRRAIVLSGWAGPDWRMERVDAFIPFSILILYRRPS